MSSSDRGDFCLIIDFSSLSQGDQGVGTSSPKRQLISYLHQTTVTINIRKNIFNQPYENGGSKR